MAHNSINRSLLYLIVVFSVYLTSIGFAQYILPELPPVEITGDYVVPKPSPYSVPEFPFVEKQEYAMPGFFAYAVPGLPEVSKLDAETHRFDAIDMSGGMNSAFFSIAPNQCNEAVNLLPDSFPGIVARKGSQRLMSVDSGTVHGLGVLDTLIVAQLGDRIYSMTSSGSYAPVTVMLYRDGQKIDSTRSEIPCFFTPVMGGLMISNGTDDPVFYDGVVANMFGVILTSASDTLDTLSGNDTCIVYDSSRTFVEDELIGYMVKIVDELGYGNDTLLWLRMIIDNDAHSFTITQLNRPDDDYEYLIMTTVDRGATIDSGGISSAGDWNIEHGAGVTESDYDQTDSVMFIEIVSDLGKGQIRHVREAYDSGNRFYVDPAFEIVPSNDSKWITYCGHMPRGQGATIHDNHFVGTGGYFKNRIFISERGNFSDFGAGFDNYVSAPGDVNRVLDFGGQIWVFGNDWIGRMLDATNLHVFVKNVGCPFPHTIATYGGNIYWLANNGVWSTKATGVAFAEGEAGLTKISTPIDDQLQDLNRRAKYAGAGFDKDGNYWLSLASSDTVPDHSFVWSTKHQSWWKQDPLAGSHFACANYPGDTTGFIFVRQDSGYVYKYTSGNDTGAEIECTYKKVFDNDPVVEKRLGHFWLYGTLGDSICWRFYENETATCGESLFYTGSAKVRKLDFLSKVSAEKITVEMKGRDSTLVINSWGIELQSLGRRMK